MHLSVAKYGGEENVLTVEIASDLSLKDLKAVIEAESDFGIKADEMSLFYEGRSQVFFAGFIVRSIISGRVLQDDNQTLEQCRFHDYDLVTCQRARCKTDLPAVVSDPPSQGQSLNAFVHRRSYIQ